MTHEQYWSVTGKFYCFDSIEEMNGRVSFDSLVDIPDSITLTPEEGKELSLGSVPTSFKDLNKGNSYLGEKEDELIVSKIKQLDEYKDKIVMMHHPYYFIYNF